MNIIFLSEIRCWIFFNSTIFSKKAVFSEKSAKNCFGHAFDNFSGKGGVLRQKRTYLFLLRMGYWIYYLAVFFKKRCNFLRKRKTIVSGGQISFEGWKWNELLNIFSFNNFFEKKQYFWRKLGKKCGGHDQFLGGHLPLKINITFFIEN